MSDRTDDNGRMLDRLDQIIEALERGHLHDVCERVATALENKPPHQFLPVKFVHRDTIYDAAGWIVSCGDLFGEGATPMEACAAFDAAFNEKKT